jgi:polysaccharide pyruvyl transferase WcaK-like protein
MEHSDGASTPGLRIVVQNGEYWLSNKGDLAMLAVTVRRLQERWPQARIGVLTSAPLLLRGFAPGTEPISDSGAGGWPGKPALGRLAERAGPRIVGPASVAWLTGREVPRRYARRIAHMLRPAGGSTGSTRSGTDTVALRHASLVLAMGGGYFTDVDPEQAHRTLDLLEYAVRNGIPAAMVGQGLGPVEDPGLLARASEVLPKVDLIALREGLRGPELLARLGVPGDRVVVTGDDAIELGYGVRSALPGNGIGICLRVAEYSPVAAATKDAVGQSVRGFASRMGAALVPLIISEYRSEDRRSTLPLVAGYPNAVRALGRYVTPYATAGQVSRCQILVTGAYHLAVFALSQGIPVVGLSSSRYYDDKFLGLDAMFGGGGLELVRLDEPDLGTRLDAAVEAAWERAPRVREPLRERARSQIEASRQGFARVFDLVESRMPGPDRIR